MRVFIRISAPLDETHLVVVRQLIHQEVLRKCVNEETSTEHRSYNHQVKRSCQLSCQDLIQYWLDKVRKIRKASSI